MRKQLLNEREFSLPHFIMLIYQTITKLNDSNLENVLKSCSDSVSTWLVAYVIYLFFISLTINNAIFILDLFMAVIQPVHSLHRDPSFDQDEYVEDIFTFYYHCFCHFVFQRIVVVFIYVSSAFIYHSIMSETHIDSILVARWWIEATIDVQCFLTLFDALLKMFIRYRRYRMVLTRFNEALWAMKIHQFYLLRYAEFHSESELNTLLVYICLLYTSPSPRD